MDTIGNEEKKEENELFVENIDIRKDIYEGQQYFSYSDKKPFTQFSKKKGSRLL
jgi:hypothetical protein